MGGVRGHPGIFLLEVLTEIFEYDKSANVATEERSGTCWYVDIGIQ